MTLDLIAVFTMVTMVVIHLSIKAAERITGVEMFVYLMTALIFNGFYIWRILV